MSSLSVSTGRDGYFAGFKDAQLHKYAAMLTRENWTVVVIDQEKDDRGKVTGRSVSRILSAGTHVEAVQSETLYLAGLWLDPGVWTDQRLPPQAGAAVIDLTTQPARVLALPDMRERLGALGAEPVGSSAAEFRVMLAEAIKKLGEIVRIAGIQPE